MLVYCPIKSLCRYGRIFVPVNQVSARLKKAEMPRISLGVMEVPRPDRNMIQTGHSGAPERKRSQDLRQ